MNILETFFNETLLNDLVIARSNVGRVIEGMKSDPRIPGSTLTPILALGGADRQLVTSGINHVLQNVENPLIEIRKIDWSGLQEKVKEFGNHIDYVIHEIDGLAKTKFDIDKISDIRSKYHAYIQHIDQIIGKNGYRVIDTKGLEMLIRDDSMVPEGSAAMGAWSSIYSAWTPFATNIKEIIDSTKEDDFFKIYEILYDQSKTVISTFDMFEHMIDSLLKKYDEMIQHPDPGVYELESRENDTLHYIHKLSKSSKGLVKFTKDRSRNYMKNVVMLEPDAFTLIETKKMAFIDQYIENISKSIQFLDAMGLDTGNTGNIIYKGVIHGFKQLEEFNVVSKDVATEPKTEPDTEKIVPVVSATSTPAQPEPAKSTPAPILTPTPAPSTKAKVPTSALSVSTNLVSTPPVPATPVSVKLVSAKAVPVRPSVIGKPTKTPHRGGDKTIKEYDSRATAQALLGLTHRIGQINIKLKLFKQRVREYEVEQKRIKYYVFYIMSVASLKRVKDLNMYIYVDRGILESYYNTLNAIKTRIKKEEQSNDVMYFDMCHHFMITRMMRFLGFLIKNMTDDDLIDIRGCTGPIVSDFVLFNHFKDIIDSYGS